MEKAWEGVGGVGVRGDLPGESQTNISGPDCPQLFGLRHNTLHTKKQESNGSFFRSVSSKENAAPFYPVERKR